MEPTVIKFKNLVTGEIEEVSFDTNFPVEITIFEEETEVQTIITGPTYGTLTKWIGGRPRRARR